MRKANPLLRKSGCYICGGDISVATVETNAVFYAERRDTTSEIPSNESMFLTREPDLGNRSSNGSGAWPGAANAPAKGDCLLSGRKSCTSFGECNVGS